jgi:hypothetical protein
MMMAGALVMAAGYGLGGEPASSAAPMTDDEQGIRQAVQYYFDGGRDADSAAMGKAFAQAVAHMMYVRDSQLINVPIPEFLARIHDQRTPGFRPDSNRRRVVAVDYAGSSGMAKLETITPQFVVVDYMALLKVGGRWTIVNKVFDRLPRN